MKVSVPGMVTFEFYHAPPSQFWHFRARGALGKVELTTDIPLSSVPTLMKKSGSDWLELLSK